MDADDLMRQASMTANTWMLDAKRAVDEVFGNVPLEVRATLIAAYVNAAAGDELAMSLFGIPEAIETVKEGIARLEEPLRKDHPLQWEDFSGLRLALLEIASSINGVAKKP